VLVAWVAGSGSGAEAARAATVEVPAAIDATGRQDVTADLNAFFAGLGPETTVTFPAGARYRIEGVLIVLNRRGLTIDGNGATFFATTDGSGVAPPRRGFRGAWPRRREQWDIRGGGDITLRNLTVRGANPHGGATAEAYVPRLEGQAGIAISRADGVTLDSVRISDTYGDFVWITGRATNVTIRNSAFARSGRQGVAIVNAAQVVVEDNELLGVAHSVFDLEPVGRANVSGIHLRHNEVGDYSNFLLAAGGSGPGVNDIWLEGNRVRGGNGVSVAAGHVNQPRQGYHLVGNTGTGTARPPAGTGRTGLIQLVNLDGVEIRDNEQQVAGGPAVSVERVCRLTVAGNDFPGASREQEVVAPCGAAAAPPPTTGRPRPGPPPTAAAIGPEQDGSESGGGDDVVWGGIVGFGAGLIVGAAGVAIVWRFRRRARPSA
jgi:hypothetical protein